MLAALASKIRRNVENFTGGTSRKADTMAIPPQPEYTFAQITKERRDGTSIQHCAVLVDVKGSTLHQEAITLLKSTATHLKETLGLNSQVELFQTREDGSPVLCLPLNDLISVLANQYANEELPGSGKLTSDSVTCMFVQPPIKLSLTESYSIQKAATLSEIRLNAIEGSGSEQMSRHFLTALTALGFCGTQNDSTARIAPHDILNAIVKTANGACFTEHLLELLSRPHTQKVTQSSSEESLQARENILHRLRAPTRATDKPKNTQTVPLQERVLVRAVPSQKGQPSSAAVVKHFSAKNIAKPTESLGQRLLDKLSDALFFPSQRSSLYDAIQDAGRPVLFEIFDWIGNPRYSVQHAEEEPPQFRPLGVAELLNGPRHVFEYAKFWSKKVL